MGTERRKRGARGRRPAVGYMGVLVAAVALGAGAASTPARAAAQQGPDADSTPHSDARLVSEVAAVRPGEPFTVGLHITLEDDWHTYWKNAGDAGNGAFVEWTLPDGFTVDSLRYPVPQRIPYPPLMNYGYKKEVVLLAMVTPPAALDAQRVRIDADTDFLVCEDVCIPAQARVGLELPVESGDGEIQPSGEAPLIARFRDRLPLETDVWTARAARTDSGFVLGVRPPEGWEGELGGAYFFPEDATTLSHTADQPAGMADGELRLRLVESEYILDEPEALAGILVLPEGAAFDDAGHRALQVAAPVSAGDVGWAAEPVTPLADPAAAAGAGGGDVGGLSLLLALGFAFVGGLILNLMPCVFPILSLKALGFASRGGDRSGMRADGLAFGSGVVLTFLAVAAGLLAVRSGGAQVGWGYQLQSPTIVALLAALMFGIGLWLAGVVELGASLTRLGEGREAEGQRSAFFTGVLATVVATPCTAPFMGAAIGAALIRPPVEALAIFAALGVGMAAPYVILSFWPTLARRLPRPGRWMETFKQVLAFPMFAVAIWLVWVFGLQVGVGGAARLLFGLLLLAVAAWLIGRWPALSTPPRVRLVTRVLAVVALAVGVLAAAAGIRGAEPLPGGAEAGVTTLRWEPYSAEAVQRHRQAGRPVFVDFTAAWCISCQVNERVALNTDAVGRALQDYDVALLKADWTRRDPAITRALASFGRAGVPLYVLYPADPSAEPTVLPELLTQTIVLDALHRTLGDPASSRQAGTGP
jgi:thiol:disulfide interchange protein/DsbC/DsbD-like thiol-disulfide interchange protein